MRNDAMWRRGPALPFTTPLPPPELIAAWPRDAVILDVGCGYGRALRHLRDAGFQRLIGLDIAEDFLARARQELGGEGAVDAPGAAGAAGVAGLELHCASCLDMPLADGSVDIALLLAVVSNCIDRRDAARLVAEVRRILRPGGIVLVQEFLPRPGFLGFRPGRRLVRAAGGLVLKHRGVRALRRMWRDWVPESVEFIPFETWTGRQHPGVRMILRKRRYSRGDKGASPVRIKDLEPADFAAVTGWFNELVAERPGIVEREPVAAGDDAFLREQVAAAARGELIVLLLYRDDRVVGKIDLRRGRRAADRHVAEVSFGLLEGFRAEGQALIAAAAERAAAWGASVLVYYIPARSWFVGVFREAGFTLAGTIPGYYNLDGEVCGRAILARTLPGGGRGAD